MPLSWQDWLQEGWAQTGWGGLSASFLQPPLGRTPAPSCPGPAVPCRELPPLPQFLASLPSHSPHSCPGLCTHSNQAQEDTDAQGEPSLHSLAQLPQLTPIHELHLRGLPLGSQCPGPLFPQDQAWAPWALPTKVPPGEVVEAHGTHRGRPPGVGFQCH